MKVYSLKYVNDFIYLTVFKYKRVNPKFNVVNVLTLHANIMPLKSARDDIFVSCTVWKYSCFPMNFTSVVFVAHVSTRLFITIL